MIRRGKAVVTAKSKKAPIKEKLFIGTLGVNCIEYTKRCLQTLSTSCAEVSFLYIDNGSSDETIEELDKWVNSSPDVQHFEKMFNGRNAGVAFGWNQIIDKALEWGATKILICNNDIAFGPHTVDGMCEAYDRLRKEIPETVMVTATNHTRNLGDIGNVKQEWSHHEHPDFACFMLTPESIDRVGMFCEDYDPAFFEDNDMHWRILLMGYKAFGTNWAPFGHMVSQTRFNNPNIISHYRFNVNKTKFCRNMFTYGPEQEVAAERYDAWIKDNPGIKHPKHTEVLDFCRQNGMISNELERYLRDVAIINSPD